MKTILMTLAGGMFVLFLTAAGVKKDVKLLNESAQESENFSTLNDFKVLYSSDLENIKDPHKKKALRVRDIQVYELEEDVELGFDTKKYLPEYFNPVKGLKIETQLEYEEQYIFHKVFGKISKQEPLRISDIEIYTMDVL